MKKLIIRKGFYWSCGKRYGWKNDGISEVGVGIAKPWLVKNQAIVVEVDKKDYYLDCKKALKFISKYKCFEDIEGVRVGYISKDLLQELKNNDA